MISDCFNLSTETSELISLQKEIIDLANSERNALGFIPASAYETAIDRGRLLALVENQKSSIRLAGFLLYSGVKTSAKIQQIAICPEFRGRGVGKALLHALI